MYRYINDKGGALFVGAVLVDVVGSRRVVDDWLEVGGKLSLRLRLDYVYSFLAYPLSIPCGKPSAWSTKTIDELRPPALYMGVRECVFGNTCVCVCRSDRALSRVTAVRSCFHRPSSPAPSSPPPYLSYFACLATTTDWENKIEKLLPQVDRVKDSGPISESYTTENLMSVVYVPLVNTK